MINVLLLDEKNADGISSFSENLKTNALKLGKTLEVACIKNLKELEKHLSNNIYNVLIAEVVNPLGDLRDSLGQDKREVMFDGLQCAPYIISKVHELQPNLHIIFYTTQSKLSIKNSINSSVHADGWKENANKQFSYFTKPTYEGIAEEVIKLAS